MCIHSQEAHKTHKERTKMQLRLNETKAAELRPKPQIYEVRDTVVRGLVLRVGKKGQKVWEIVVSRAGKRTRHRLGSYPDLSVKDARNEAEALKESAVVGSRSTGVKTVADLFERYKAARSGHLRSWTNIEAAWRNLVSDQIGHIRVSDLSIHHGLDLRDYISDKTSELRAGAVLRCIRPMFTWATDERLIPINPWVGLRSGALPVSRDRVLSDMEWAALWAASLEIPYPFGPFVRSLMLSAQRRANVAQMRWDEMHGDVWVIPREKMKSTRAASAKSHEVPLSSAFATLIAEQPRLGPYVFTTRGDIPIKPGSKLKNRLSEVANLSDWRLHDIRRTAATKMATAGVSRFIVERVLGHSDNSITAVYDRATYREEKREALSKLERMNEAHSASPHAKGS